MIRTKATSELAATVARVKVQLSGDVAVSVDGRAVDVGPVKCRAVLAALALSAGRPVSTSAIIDLVWGDEPPRTAEKTLQSYVTALRKVIGESTIERVGAAYKLTVDDVDVDLLEFAKLIEAGDLVEGLARWGGPPLVGLGSGGFGPTIVKFTELYLDALERRVGADIEAGRGSAHLAALSQLTNEHPLRERLWALRMRALYQSSRQGEALRVFTEARDVLVDQLGIEPGAELRDIERQILTHDPALAGRATPEPVQSGLTSARLLKTDGGRHMVRSFLFTDIQDSTGMWERHSELMRAAVAKHDEEIVSAVETNGGTVFKNTGDGALASFSSSDDAVNASVAIQLALDRVHVGGEPFAVRIAISAGRAEPRGADWFGPPLNVAARLLDAAHGSQILIGTSAHSGLGNQLSVGVDTTELGEFRLKGLSRTEHVHQVLHAGLPRRFPPLRTAMRDDRETQNFPPELAYEGRVAFVGRVDLVDQIEAIWATTLRDANPTIVTLGGEPGIGKTRLTGEMARRFHEDHGAMVLYGRCPEDHPTAFRPFTEALTAYSRARSDSELRTELGPRPGYLAPLLPHLPERFPDITAAVDVSEETRLEIFDAVTAFLESASTSPLVIVIDDIHWADQASLSLLRHLAQHLSTGRLLILATYRDVEVERTHPLSRVLADFRREDAVVRLRVKGISSEDSIAMTEVMFGHELSETGRELVRNIATDAGGNPFFLQELLRHFIESGVVVRQDGRWTANPDHDIEASIPEGIREVVGRRLDRVSEACNTLLRTASAIPTAIDFDVLAAAANLDEDDALDLFDEALEAELILDTPAGYEFSHALIRQSLYDEISTVRKLRLHQRIAQAFKERPRRDVTSIDAMAFHFLEAATSAEPEDVAMWVCASAQLALDRFAYEEAYDLLDRVQELVEGSLSDASAYKMHAQVAVAAAQNLRFEHASRAVEKCIAIVGSIKPELAADGALKITAALPGRSLTQGAFLLVARLLEQIDTSELDAHTVVAIKFNLGSLSHQGPMDVDAFLDLLTTGDDASRLRALTATVYPIAPMHVLDRLAAAVAPITEDASTTELLDASRFMLAVLEGMRGNVAEMRQLMGLVNSSPSADKSRNLIYGIARLCDFPRNVRHGDFTSARQALKRVHQNIFGGLLDVYATRVLEHESDIETRTAFEDTEPAYATWALATHMHDQALSDEFIGAAIERRSDIGTTCLAADAVAERGSSIHVEKIWDRLIPARGQGVPYLTGFCTFAVDHHLALLAELRDELDLAITLHHDALALHRRNNLILDQVLSTSHLVRVLAQRGRPDDLQLARELTAEAEALAAETDLTRAKRLLAEANAGLPD